MIANEQLGKLDPGSASVLAVSVGNSNTAFARCAGKHVGERAVIPDHDTAALLDRLQHAAEDTDAILIASVNDQLADTLEAKLRERTATGVYRLARDLPIPIERAIHPDTNPGHDRLLNALAAHHALQQACVVVDAGTAVTVDFVDGEGTFQGGAIAPGLRMMLAAMHERTDALPPVTPDPGQLAEAAEHPFGKRTEHAMLIGAAAAIQGLVRLLTERYAIAYDAYPLLIATGGDAQTLFAQDELVDRIVPDLTLRGILASFHQAIDTEPDPNPATSP